MTAILSANIDFETGDLFIDDPAVQEQVRQAEAEKAQAKPNPPRKPRTKAQVPEAPPPPPAASTPTPPKNHAARGSRKSRQGFEYEDSLEGAKEKYDATSHGEYGNNYTVILADGSKVRGRWKLVDAFSITPSHNPLDRKSMPGDTFGYSKSKGFPTGHKSGNSRDYETDSAAAASVQDLAGNFDGRALKLDDPIVVFPNGIVLSGNNRAMSSILAARMGSDGEYLEMLEERASLFGFSPELIAEFEHPRVVLEVESNDYSAAHFDKFNQSDRKQEDPTALAKKLGKTVPEQALGILVTGMDTFGSFRDFLSNSAAKDLLDSLVYHGVLTQPQAEGFKIHTDTGGLTNGGKEFVRALVLGNILDADLIDATVLNYSDALEKIILASPAIIRNSLRGDYSVKPKINDAVRFLVGFRSWLSETKQSLPSNTDKKRILWDAYMSQSEMFGGKDPLTSEVAWLLLTGSANSLNLLMGNVDKFVATASEEAEVGGFFEPEPIEELLRRAMEQTKKDEIRVVQEKAEKKKGSAVSSASGVYMIRNVWYLPSSRGYVVTGGGATETPIPYGGKTLFSNKAELSKAAAPSWLDLQGSSLIRSAFIASADIKARVTKWVGGNPDRKAAWQKAIQEYRDTWGKNPQTEKDARLILKVAHKIHKKGGFDDSMFGEARQEVEQGIPTADGSVADIPEPPQPEPQASGQAQERIQNIADEDPIALFKVIQGWLAEGRFTKDQVAAAFKYVFSQAGQSQQAFSSWLKLSQGGFSFLGSHGPVSPPCLAQSWGEAHAFISGMVRNGVTDGKYITNALSRHFNTDLKGVMPAYSVYTGRKPWVFCRYRPLPQSIRAKHEIMVGSRVIFSGVEGTVKKIFSNGLLEVERPASIPEGGFITDTAHSSEVVLSRGEQLDLDFDAEGPGGDPAQFTRDPSAPTPAAPVKNKGGRPRKQRPEYANNIIDILRAVPSFTKAPASLDDRRLNYELVPAIKTANETVPPHAAFWYTEKMPDGNNYTVEFHVDPEPDASGSHYCAVYVLNDSLGPQDSVIAQFDIEDLADWNLGEADRIDSAIVKAQAGDGVDVALAQAAERLPQHVLAGADFNRFWGNLNGYATCSGRVPRGDGEVLRATVYALLSGSGEPLWKQIVEAQKARSGGLPDIPPADVAKLPAGTWDRWKEEFEAGTINPREVYATAKEAGIGTNVSMRISNWASGLSVDGGRADPDYWVDPGHPPAPTTPPGMLPPGKPQATKRPPVPSANPGPPAAKGSQLDLFNSAKRSNLALGWASR